jgi:hypothetical protein
MLEGSVVGLLGIPGKTAGGQLPAPQVVLQALATDPFLGAGIIAAVASLHVLLFSALHGGAPQ